MGDESLGFFAAPSKVSGLDGSLFLSESDELPDFFEDRGCGGLGGCSGFRG